MSRVRKSTPPMSRPMALDGADRHFPVVRMNDVGDIDRRAAGRQVGGRAQIHDLVLRRHGVLVVADLRQQAFRLVIELEARQHLLVADAAARILVDDVDELFDRVLAVADDVSGHALRRGDQLAVDDEQAMIEALDVAFDDDRAAVFAALSRTRPRPLRPSSG